MNLYTNDVPLFNVIYILKRILVALIYPLGIIIFFVIKLGTENRDYTWLILFVSIPFSGMMLFSILKNFKFSLKKFSVDSSTRKIEITYFRFTKIMKLHADSSNIYVKFRRDNWTLYEYYVLEFYNNDKLLFKQYQEGDWSREIFFSFVRSLLDNSIKCIYPIVLKKELLDNN